MVYFSRKVGVVLPRGFEHNLSCLSFVSLSSSGVLHLCAICEVVLRKVDLAKRALSDELVKCVVSNMPQLFRGELPANCVSTAACVKMGLDLLEKL